MALNMNAVRLAAEHARVRLRKNFNPKSIDRDKLIDKFKDNLSENTAGALEEATDDLGNGLFAGHVTKAMIGEVTAKFAETLGDKLNDKITPEAKMDAAVEALLQLEDDLGEWVTDPGNCLSETSIKAACAKLRDAVQEAAADAADSLLEQYAEREDDRPAALIPLDVVLSFVDDLIGALGGQPDQQAEIRRTVEIAWSEEATK